MNLFMNVAYSDDIITKEFNFENIYRSIITLFPLCTSGGLRELLDSLTHEGPPFCNPNATSSQLTKGDCGSMALAIPYLVSFIIVTFFVVINMYIAVILENFMEAKEDMQTGITDDDFHLYCEAWQRFDPNRTEFIKYEELSDFVDSLYESSAIKCCNSNQKKQMVYESPLRIPKPNEEKLISMDIILCSDNLVHFTDVLEALVRNHFGVDQPDCPVNAKNRCINYNPVSSTLKNIKEYGVKAHTDSNDIMETSITIEASSKKTNTDEII